MSIGALANLLLPIIESSGGTAALGSTAAAVGRAVVPGEIAAAKGAAPTSGLGDMIHKLMGGPEGFANQEGLGAGVQQAQQLADAIAKMQLGLEANGKQMQELIASAKAKPGTPDPFTGAMGPGTPDRSQDPAHLESLAALQRQRSSMEQQAKSMASQLAGLHSRISQTTNPVNYAPLVGNAALLGGSAQVASSVISSGGGGFGSQQPGLLGSLGSIVGLGRKVAAPAAGVVDPATRNVLDGASSYLGQMLTDLADPLKTLSGQNFTNMAKLPGLIKDWSQALLDSKRDLGKFNATIADASAFSDQRSLLRSIATARNTSGAYSELTKQTERFKDISRGTSDAASILAMTAFAKLTEKVNDAIVAMDNVANAIYPFQKRIDDGLRLLNGNAGNHIAPPFATWLRETNNRDPRDLR